MEFFYVRNVLGKDGRLTKAYKIRTMIPNADDLYSDLLETNGFDRNGKIRNDPRLTKIGRFLRKYWLDEVPQIFTNLLAGNMSLVGIRPRDEEKWKLYPPEHMARTLKYKPGLFYVGYLSEGDSFSDLIEFERTYLDEKEIHPFLTDVKYFSRLVYGIVFKGIRSH